ncbi:hypothetical protein CPB85DRAFT_1311792 [Mucidula mucida]|nr:hypothetical protein CPB85DRAFT_1311792 [Mucidula mucida]
MTEAFSDENLKRFIILTISHPPSQNVMSKWNTNNPQRGIPCTYCSETKRSCRSLATRLNCSSRSCSQNGEPCSRINEELFDRVKAAWPHVLRTDFDAALKEIRAEEPPKDTPRLLPSPEMDVRSMSTPSNGVGSADTPVTHVAALPGYSENAEETASPTSEALITGDPFANLPGGNTIPTNSERHGKSPQTKVSIPERGLSDPSTMVNVSSSILPRYSYYRPSCHVPSAIASYSPFAPLPSKSAAASKASANAAADLEQRILALIAERDAAVATNAENAEQMRLLEAAAAELQVVLDGKNELKSRMDVLQAENATLHSKRTPCAPKETPSLRVTIAFTLSTKNSKSLRDCTPLTRLGRRTGICGTFTRGL